MRCVFLEVLTLLLVTNDTHIKVWFSLILMSHLGNPEPLGYLE